MKLKTLVAVAVVAAFAMPFAASADGDRMILAQAGGPSGASSVGTGPTGGAASPQSAGEPAIQADRCKSLTGMERDNCVRDSRTSSGATSGGTAPSGSGTTGTTAGPGSASNKTGSGSDTATSPSTSGQGTAK